MIEVELEGCRHEVIAPSFTAFLEEHADALERGDYRLGELGIESTEANVSDPTTWGLPAYLAGAVFEEAADAPAPTSPERIGPDEEVTLEGEMGTLMGGKEVFFTIHTADGREHTVVAKPGMTKGYSSIAIRQGARVVAKRYTPEIGSWFVDEMGSEPPEFVALTYYDAASREGLVGRDPPPRLACRVLLAPAMFAPPPQPGGVP